MAPVNGRPFLEYLLDYCIEQGVRRFILSVGYRRDVIQSHLGDSYRGVDVVYAAEDVPLGTGGGLLRAMTWLRARDPFFILNGDTYFEVSFAELAQFHANCHADMTLGLRGVADCSRYTRIELDRESGVAAFHTRGSSAGAGLINGGVYLATRDAFEGFSDESHQEISLEDDLFPRMLARGRRLCGYRCQGRFIDIGVPDDYRRAATLLGTT